MARAVRTSTCTPASPAGAGDHTLDSGSGHPGLIRLRVVRFRRLLPERRRGGRPSLRTLLHIVYFPSGAVEAHPPSARLPLARAQEPWEVLVLHGDYACLADIEAGAVASDTHTPRRGPLSNILIDSIVIKLNIIF